MRKWLINLTGLLTISSSALPLTGCTFNFYVNRVKERVARNLAIQTSSVIKSLIASKELSADTKSTIADALSINGDSIISNPSAGSTQINNWDDFKNSWGLNNNITTKGFNGNDFIVPTGQGSLTSQVNSLKSTNTSLSYLTYINALNVIDNNTLYGVLLANNAIGKPIIKSVLTELKNQTLPEPFGSLINSLINDYQGNFLAPITTLLTELVNGWSDVTDPANLKTYMEQWKDPSNIPYSQWINLETGQWEMANPTDWTTDDINIYHGGTYINYVFKKIGSEHTDKIPNPQYLGDIITSAIDGTSVDLEKILEALQPYLDLLLTNPKYLLTIITGAIPVIKQIIFEPNDLSKGIEKLTLGNHYKTDKPNNSYNLFEVFSNVKNLLDTGKSDDPSNPTALEDAINNLLSSKFLFDVKLEIEVLGTKIKLPLPSALNVAPGGKKDLINTITGFLTDPSFKQTFNDIYKVIEKLNNQFQGSDGINLNLINLKDLLLNNNNGLLVLLEEVANTIADIIKPNQDDDITDEQLERLYESIGGQLPGEDGSAPSTFRDNSLIQVLKDALADKDSDLNVLVKILTRDDQYQGVANIITEQNETWIKENYTNYLQPTYPKTSIANTKYKTSENATQKITDISYDFYYEVNGVKYHFFIKGIAVDNKDSFLGTHNFKFTDIYNI